MNSPDYGDLKIEYTEDDVNYLHDVVLSGLNLGKVWETQPWDGKGDVLEVPPIITRFPLTSSKDWRDMPVASTVVLLTPVLVPAGTMGSYQENPHTDPFERLGRLISSYNRRVRHVPYLVWEGLTALHRSYIKDAGAVITVICEPEGPGRTRENSMRLQRMFARNVASAWNVPCGRNLLICCGGAGLEWEERRQQCVECTRYTDQLAEDITCRLFTGSPCPAKQELSEMGTLTIS